MRLTNRTPVDLAALRAVLKEQRVEGIPVGDGRLRIGGDPTRIQRPIYRWTEDCVCCGCAGTIPAGELFTRLWPVDHRAHVSMEQPCCQSCRPFDALPSRQRRTRQGAAAPVRFRKAA